MVLEKTWETLGLQEIKPVNPKVKSTLNIPRLMLKLKLQYLGHLMWRSDSLEETLLLGKTEGRRKRGQLRMKWLDSITDSLDTSLSKPAICRVAKSWTKLSDWTTTSLPPGYSKLCAMVPHSGQSSWKRYPISKTTLFLYSCHMNVSDATAKC